MVRKSAWLLSAALIGFASPALAQEAANQSAPASANDTLNANDVVVTATRRNARLSDVPIAVSAVTADSLANSGGTDIRALNQLTPSLLISSTSSESNAAARIRGIGTVGDNPGLESSVATFIDGVYRSRSGIGLNELGDIDRIEVLRGPQGTLYGRNSTAGLINIVTKAPEFKWGGNAEASYGNYDAVRLAGGVTGPVIADTLAFRLDGVYFRRQGFFHDVVNDSSYSDRDRYLVRGQLLFQPSADFSVRLIGDYSHRYEGCCGAVIIDTREKFDPTPGVPGDYAIAASNRIYNVMTSLGGLFPSAGDPYNRQVTNTAGRDYRNATIDWGGSGQVDWNLGGAKLTSITAYRFYKAGTATDADYSNVDISYRANDGLSYRRFNTFTQELRLQGSAFADRLDWLVGGYYSHEKIQVSENTKFGSQYGAFASCRTVATLDPNTALRNPNLSGCLTTTGRTQLTTQYGAGIVNGLDLLYTLNNLGSKQDVYDQTSENYAFFTHNIFRLTDRLSVTAGLRYTHEHKTFAARFDNNNTICPQEQAALGPSLSNSALATAAGTIIALSCAANNTSGLTGINLSDAISESEFTGTAVLSWKPIDPLLVYASYSRGYKAGGYNLDKSDMGSALFARSASDVVKLRFDPELVNSYEAGFKYSSRAFTLNAAVFRQDFKDFQLNAFNGSNFVVQNIGSCDQNLNGADSDASSTTGACTGKVGTGVRSQGVELEAGLYPARNFAVTVGYTLADTKYRNNLVGSAAGEALDAGLFLLPGSQMSNAPRNVVTTSASWTPALGSRGLTGLVYVDSRTTSDYRTGSDLFTEKAQDGYTLVNARLGVRGPDQRWAVEVWAQNVFDTNYTQVAFNTPFQGGGSIAQVQKFGVTGTQLFSAFLGEPRTYGLTVKGRF